MSDPNNIYNDKPTKLLPNEFMPDKRGISLDDVPEEVKRYAARQIAENTALGEELFKESVTKLEAKNIVDYNEYVREFGKLHNKSIADSGLSIDEYNKLSRTYRERFDLHADIKLTNGMTAEGQLVIVAKIPAQYKTIEALSTDKSNSHMTFIQDGCDDLKIYRDPAMNKMAASIISNQTWIKKVSEDKLEVAKVLIQNTARRGPITEVVVDGENILKTSNIADMVGPESTSTTKIDLDFD